MDTSTVQKKANTQIWEPLFQLLLGEESSASDKERISRLSQEAAQISSFVKTVQSYPHEYEWWWDKLSPSERVVLGFLLSEIAGSGETRRAITAHELESATDLGQPEIREATRRLTSLRLIRVLRATPGTDVYVLSLYDEDDGALTPSKL